LNVLLQFCFKILNINIFFFTPDLIFLKEQNQSGGIRNAYKNLVGKHEGNKPFWRPMCKCEELWDGEMKKSLVQAKRNFENLRTQNNIYHLKNYQIFKEAPLPWSY
jgi:hypothetical protein